MVGEKKELLVTDILPHVKHSSHVDLIIPPLQVLLRVMMICKGSSLEVVDVLGLRALAESSEFIRAYNSKPTKLAL